MHLQEFREEEPKKTTPQVHKPEDQGFGHRFHPSETVPI
jgi:hypothetical protein